MNRKTEHNVKKLFAGRTILKTREILDFMQEQNPGLNETTLRWRLHSLKNKGIIRQPGRGVYSLNVKPDYSPDLSGKLKRLHESISKSFPLVTFCVWDSQWFNEFMIHQAFKRYYVVEVEKEAAEAVFYQLSGKNKNIFLNPKKEVFEKYLVNYDEATIIISLISESPLKREEKYNIPGLEKLLVDCIVGGELFQSQQNDLEYIIQAVFEKYNINPGRIKRYANRRNVRDRIESILNKYSANTI